VPLTPRGSASAGYGGAVPAAGGIVVDMYRMRGLVSVDTEAGTATALPATTLQDIDEALRAQGFRMPLMPTSAPSATIGGLWARAVPASAAPLRAPWPTISCR
uniref:FAD-binding oxidoreductase n=1 Tax=Adlercreutzia caecimuris TaxID=671266 RepID=UPI0025B0721B